MYVYIYCIVCTKWIIEEPETKKELFGGFPNTMYMKNEIFPLGVIRKILSRRKFRTSSFGTVVTLEFCHPLGNLQ